MRTGRPCLRLSTVTVVVRDSWSHVCGPVLDWPCALRWWMAADCSDSLRTQITSLYASQWIDSWGVAAALVQWPSLL